MSTSTRSPAQDARVQSRRKTICTIAVGLVPYMRMQMRTQQQLESTNGIGLPVLCLHESCVPIYCWNRGHRQGDLRPRQRGGTAAQPTRDSRSPSANSGSATAMGPALPRTRPRRRGGSAVPPTKAMRLLSSTLPSITRMGQASPRTGPRRCGGTAAPPTRVTRKRSTVSAFATQKGAASPRT